MPRHIIETGYQTLSGGLTIVGTFSAQSYLGLPAGGSDDVEASTKVRASSASWDSTYTTVLNNSASWSGGGGLSHQQVLIRTLGA